MTNRRVDLLFFGILLSVLSVAYLASTRSSEPLPDRIEIPALDSELEPPAVDLPEPAFVFRFRANEGRPVVFRPRLLDEMERALAEVRSALLSSSLPREVAYASDPQPERLRAR
jgi:hypothetical protein